MSSYEINELARKASRTAEEATKALAALSETARATTAAVRALTPYLERLSDEPS